MFILAISCLTTSNLPWFMDLTFQVPMQSCSLQHGVYFHHQSCSQLDFAFCFGSISSFFLHIGHLLTWGVHLSVSFLSFCLFILFMGFSKQEYWNGLPFPSPVDHILSEISTMTCPSWVALHGMTCSFSELDKPVVHVIRLASFLWLWFSVCLPSDGEG